MKLTKTVVTGAVLSLAFLANCDYILGTTWHFSDVEMRAAVEGTWKLTRESGESITLVARQATAMEQSARDRGFVTSAVACGDRSFVRQAAACSDYTRMPLELTAADHTVSDAAFVVHSTTFKRGELRFTIDGANVNADVDPSGKVTSAKLYTSDNPNPTQVTLQRIAKI